jgi:hypothetical protein
VHLHDTRPRRLTVLWYFDGGALRLVRELLAYLEAHMHTVADELDRSR